MLHSVISVILLGHLALKAVSDEVQLSSSSTDVSDYQADPPVPWSEIWWEGKLAVASFEGSPAPPDPETGVALAIEYPIEGSITRNDPNLGDVVPQLRLEFGDGWLADLVRSNVSAWGLCLSLDGVDASCTPIMSEPGQSNDLPKLRPDTRRGSHVLRAWLGSTRRGRGPHDIPPHPSAQAVVRFSTQESMLGTGCRSVANWFLAATAPPEESAPVGESDHDNSDPPMTGRGLMAKWWRGMARRWQELAALRNDVDEAHALQQQRQRQQAYASSGIHSPPLPALARHPWTPLWRYFEMDCVLSGLRHEDVLVDNAVMQLAGFPVGKLGEKRTPHEYLSKPVNFTAMNHHPPWMLKLKALNSVNPDAYRDHIAAAIASSREDQETFDDSALGAYVTASKSTTNGGVPKVVWMYWEQGEKDASLDDQARLCIEGWRLLNPSWEVRLLDAATARTWAPPVFALVEGCSARNSKSSLRDNASEGATRRSPCLPEGGRIQHTADLLRAYLLARYGGVWTDVSVLPLVPLDNWLVCDGLGHNRKVLSSRYLYPRNFFAYTFSDPSLSWEVSVIPTVYDEWDEPDT